MPHLSPFSSVTTNPDRRRWMALVVVCLAQLMIVLDTTIVNVALPRSEEHTSELQSPC